MSMYLTTYCASDIANYIITKCENDGIPISNLQLQKILYYIQRDYARTTGNQLFSDRIEAWQFGPVIPDVYYTYAVFGGTPILSSSDSTCDSISPSIAKIIDPIIEDKRNLNPWTLVEDTHKSGGAWDEIYQDGEGNRQEIPLELIKAKG